MKNTCKHNWQTLTALANGKMTITRFTTTFIIVQIVRPSCMSCWNTRRENKRF